MSVATPRLTEADKLALMFVRAPEHSGADDVVGLEPQEEIIRVRCRGDNSIAVRDASISVLATAVWCWEAAPLYVADGPATTPPSWVSVLLELPSDLARGHLGGVDVDVVAGRVAPDGPDHRRVDARYAGLELGAVDPEIDHDRSVDPGRTDVDVAGHHVTGQVLGLDLYAHLAPSRVEDDLGLAAGAGARGRYLVVRRELGLQLPLAVVDPDQLEDLAGGANGGEPLLAHDVQLALAILAEAADEHADRTAGRDQLGQLTVVVDVEQSAQGSGETGW